MNLIAEVCEILLSLFFKTHWAIGWIWPHLTSGEGRDYKRIFVCIAQS